MCYLKVALGRGILYKNHRHTRVECFSDTYWVGSRDDRRSTSGYCVFVGRNMVSWKSKKTKCCFSFKCWVKIYNYVIICVRNSMDSISGQNIELCHKHNWGHYNKLGDSQRIKASE